MRKPGSAVNLLTLNDEYLAPYEEARSRIHDELARLSQTLDLKERTSVNFERLVDLSSRKLDELQQTIELARRAETAKALDEVRSDRGKVLMDQIRDCVLRIEDRDRRGLESAQRALDRAELQRDGIFGAVALISLAFLFWAYQKIRHEAKVRAEARFEIERQKDLLKVTLLSIGDAVIITDVEGRITLMNQVAEELTGWLLKDARGQECATVFRIKNQQTGQSVESPVAKVLREGMIVGVANHSLLLRRDGTEIPIDDTPKGGHIAVRTFNADAALCVSFTDTGVGVSAETLQRLFKPFDVRSRESGFFGHLTKPVDFQQLRELINQVPLA